MNKFDLEVKEIDRRKITLEAPENVPVIRGEKIFARRTVADPSKIKPDRIHWEDYPEE